MNKPSKQSRARYWINWIALYQGISLPFCIIAWLSQCCTKQDKTPTGVCSKADIYYDHALRFLATNSINISIIGGITYGILSKNFPSGIIPGIPEGLNTPASLSFGIVAIFSIAITSLLAYKYLSQDNSEKTIKERKDDFLDLMSWTNPATVLVNAIDIGTTKLVEQVKPSNPGQSIDPIITI